MSEVEIRHASCIDARHCCRIRTSFELMEPCFSQAYNISEKRKNHLREPSAGTAYIRGQDDPANPSSILTVIAKRASQDHRTPHAPYHL